MSFIIFPFLNEIIVNWKNKKRLLLQFFAASRHLLGWMRQLSVKIKERRVICFDSVKISFVLLDCRWNYRIVFCRSLQTYALTYQRLIIFTWIWTNENFSKKKNKKRKDEIKMYLNFHPHPIIGFGFLFFLSGLIRKLIIKWAIMYCFDSEPLTVPHFCFRNIALV